MRLALVLALAAVAACRVDDALPPSPAATATADEARAAARLRDHLAHTAGVADASVLVHLPVADPFARGAPAAPAARVAIAVATTAGADTGAIGDVAIVAARTLLGADADVQVQVAPPPPPAPALVRVGPFRVAAASRAGLVAVLAAALLAVAGLAAALAWALYRRGMSPHQSSTSTTRGS